MSTAAAAHAAGEDDALGEQEMVLAGMREHLERVQEFTGRRITRFDSSSHARMVERFSVPKSFHLPSPDTFPPAACPSPIECPFPFPKRSLPFPS